MTFLIGAMVGAVIGIGTMCFMVVAAEDDKLLEKNHVIFDVKAIMPRELVDGRL